MTRPPLVKSLGVKLGLVLFVVVTVAMAIVYLAVVPRLESRLVSATLDDLRRASPALATTIRVNDSFDYQRIADFAATQLDARVVVFQYLTGDTLIVDADSNNLSSQDVLRNPVALEVASTGAAADGRTVRAEREFADVAVPVDGGNVLLLSAPLDDELSAVEVVRRDVLIAGGIALAVSWLLGSLGALRLTRRLSRLERAAERIADGDFEAKIADPGEDEVAQLARTFDRMRVRLAHLDRARREFIANASHELRTPLFALAGFLELLADEDLDGRTRRDFLDTARGQLDRLTRLATDLLDLSRLDAGELGLESEPVDLAAVAAELIEEFGPLAEIGGRTLGAGAGEGAVAVGDPERVRQIGRSLVENAIRHTPAGSRIEVAVAATPGQARLTVRDDGPGIAPEEQTHVFERFYRGEGGAASGSGIGLTIARELAARMDGSIELVSAPSDTAFTLALPRVASRAGFPRENALVR